MLFVKHLKHHSPAFIKFCMVGVVNLGIDFLILNFLSYLTQIYSGFGVVALNTISFSVAVTNSYFLNKRWTFQHKEKASSAEFSKFILVNIGGTVINSSIVFVITTFFTANSLHLHPQLWLNAAKIIALPLSTLWNFSGSRFIVFKHRPTSPLL